MFWKNRNRQEGSEWFIETDEIRKARTSEQDNYGMFFCHFSCPIFKDLEGSYRCWHDLFTERWFSKPQLSSLAKLMA